MTEETRINDVHLRPQTANALRAYWCIKTKTPWTTRHNPTVAEVRDEILSYRLNPATAPRGRGYGKKAHEELCRAVGVDVPTRKIAINPNWKFHPMTGDPIIQPQPTKP